MGALFQDIRYAMIGAAAVPIRCAMRVEPVVALRND